MLKVDQSKKTTYSMVKFDADGWASASEFMPADYDLCALMIKDNKKRNGWVKGTIWDGLNIKKDDEVMYWKRIKE